ncbi:MAG: hypothetical protein ABI459_02770 [Deltaproteobacteria bacterium]
MTMRIAFGLAFVVLVILALDATLWHWAIVIYLGQCLIDIIEYVTIWNRL